MRPWSVCLLSFFLFCFSCPAATHYVDVNSPGPIAPYGSWASAATSIQDAIDQSAAGDTVIVADGTYSSGGRVVGSGSLMNRVVVDKAISIRSMNGPAVTVIAGNPLLGANAVRCIYLTNGASISGFTFVSGGTRTSGSATLEQSAGGVFATATNVVISNCLVENCLGNQNAGGIYSGTIYNTIIASNSMGGAFGSTLVNSAIFKNGGTGAGNARLYNCTVSQNAATNLIAGGISNSTAYNSIIWQNTGLGVTSNFSSTSVLYSSSTFPQPVWGSNNIALDPQLVDFQHIGSSSPCRGTGDRKYANGVDLDGDGWLSAPSIGCDEYSPGGPLRVAIAATYTNGAANFPVHLWSMANGSQSGNVWDFGDGTFATNQFMPYHTWSNPGDYVVTLTAFNADHPAGVSASLLFQIVAQPVHYVSAANATPVAPYTSWSTAATNIQDAVDAASTWGAMVMVSNGVYRYGGRTNLGARLTNRVCITVPLFVQSANGPTNTVIAGIGNQGNNSVRCVSLTNGAWLAGFTLSNGATRSSASVTADYAGAGVFCSGNEAVISNCVIVSNNAYLFGNGVYGGSIYNCSISNNGSLTGGSPYGVAGGGVYGAMLFNCTMNSNIGRFGGAVAQSVLSNCYLFANTGNAGGASYSNILTDCALVSNTLNGYYYSPRGGAGSYLDDLTACTISANAGGQSWEGGGGAAYSSLSNCTLIGNSDVYGGGASSSVLRNCRLIGNSAASGGAAYGTSTSPALLYNCLIVSNAATNYYGFNPTGSAGDGVVLYNCTVVGNVSYEYYNNPHSIEGGISYNSIIYDNIVSYAPFNNGSWYYDTLYMGPMTNCCTDVTSADPGNIIANPQFVDPYRIGPNSPCRGTGDPAYASGTDIDGETWQNPPSIGCKEYYPGGELSVGLLPAFTNVASGFLLNIASQIAGSRNPIVWDFGDGSTASNLTNVIHSWPTPGDYLVTLTAYNADHLEGVIATMTIHVSPRPVFYVDINGNNPTAPYASWATAATNIQDAVDVVTVPGSVMLVNDGIYASGGRVAPGYSLTNRVTVGLPLTLQSVNGPEVTIIQGYQVPTTTNGVGAVRCVYLTNGSALSGFTIVNGATLTNVVSGDPDRCGGGVYCEADSVVVSNCLIISNAAFRQAGGVFNGEIVNCVVANNTANGGGGACGGSALNSSFFLNSAYEGGGVEAVNLNNCVLSNNYAKYYGGGSFSEIAWHNKDYFAQLRNCLIIGNSTGGHGGGTMYGVLDNCVLFGNTNGGLGGGAYDALLNNCTIVSNRYSGCWGDYAFPMKINNCVAFGNEFEDVYSSGTNTLVNNSCFQTIFGCTVSQCITNDPQFTDPANGDFRLQPNSPCINAGNNLYLTNLLTDLDGNPRISGGTVDMGAYEFQNPASSISYAWLQQFGLPTDGSADSLDSDSDGLNNMQEWRVGTNPTNAGSVLQLLSPTNSGGGLMVTWQSATNINYLLQRTLSLTAANFQTIATNIPGQSGSTSYRDTNAPAPGPWFYRVGVQ